MRITRAVETAILEHARAEAPRECCGLLIGTDTDILDSRRATNLAADPLRRYLIEPQGHLQAIRDARARGLQVVGAYHSHPRSTAVPSATDVAEGFGHFVFVIAGLSVEPPELMAWEWTDGNFAAVPLVRFS
jgi:proteasome lid subunit RPN8/RPN11